MALSGSVSTNKYEQRYLTLTWTATQSIANNTSTITWVLKGAGGSSTLWYYCAPFKVEIAGKTVYNSSTRIKVFNGTQIATGKITLNHNANGNKTFAVKIQGAIYSSEINCVGSGSFTLNQIARKATIVSAPNFNDTDNPKITYSNPLGSKVTTLQACIAFDSSNIPVAYRNISKTGTAYTFNLTTAERQSIYDYVSVSNSATMVFYIKSVINDTTYYDSVSRTMTITDANPYFEWFSINDTQPESLALTGDQTKIIKGFNKMNISVQPKALKGAEIVNTTVICGDGKSIKDVAGDLTNVTSGKFILSTIDSRNNATVVTLNRSFVDYIPKTCNLTAKAELDSDNTTKINYTVKGNFFNGSFGNVQVNLITVVIRYKSTDEEEYSDWRTLFPTLSGNTYSCTGAFTGLDYTKTYQVQAYISDKVPGGTYSKTVTVKTKPVFDWGENDFNFNVPVIFPNGANAVRGTNTNGTVQDALQPCNNADSLVLGFGGYYNAIGRTNVYGNDVNVFTNGDFKCNNSNVLCENSDYLKSLYLKPGDTITLAQYSPFTAYISNAAKSVYITIPVSKPMIGIKKATLSGKFKLRGINGYLNNTNDVDMSKTGGDNSIISKIDVTVVDGVGLYIAIVFKAAIQNATNNTPASVSANTVTTITFS